MTRPPLRIGPGGDVLVERTADTATVRLSAARSGTVERGRRERCGRIEGQDQHGGRVALGGWGVTEALRRSAALVLAPGVTAGGLVAGAAAWHFGWDRTDWDELAAAVVAGRILARADAGTVVVLHADGTSVVTPATVDALTAHVLGGLTGPELVEPDATVRLNSVRLAGRGGSTVVVHSVRGLPAPATALVELEEPSGWEASATFAVVGADPPALATRVWEAAGGAVEVAFTRRERPHPLTWADTVAELRATVVHPDAVGAQRAMAAAATAIAEARIPGVAPLEGPPFRARRVTTRRVRHVPTGDLRHELVIDGERIAIPPAPTQPPPLARRPHDTVPTPAVAGRRVAPEVTTHPETIAALRDDLSRRRLAAGPAEDDSVHWDAQPAVRVPLGELARAQSSRTWRDGTEALTIVVWVGTADAYDWLQWHLDGDRVAAMLPAQAAGAPRRIELPNLHALAFVLGGTAGVPAGVVAEHVRAQDVDLPALLRSTRPPSARGTGPPT